MKVLLQRDDNVCLRDLSGWLSRWRQRAASASASRATRKFLRRYSSPSGMIYFELPLLWIDDCVSTSDEASASPSVRSEHHEVVMPGHMRLLLSVVLYACFLYARQLRKSSIVFIAGRGSFNSGMNIRLY